MQAHTNSDVPLLHEFHSLSMLLAATTTINRGQPRQPPQPASEKYRGSLEWSSNSHELALNAIATLLVRAHEVVAVIGHDSQHVFAMQNEVPENYGKGSVRTFKHCYPKPFQSFQKLVSS
jgi:hypothetical protein